MAGFDRSADVVGGISGLVQGEAKEVKIHLDLNSGEDYRKFLAIKTLPSFRFQGRIAEFPDEYAGRLGQAVIRQTGDLYRPLSGLFDYQRDVSRMAIDRRKFAIFADCGLGKTLMILEFARHAQQELGSNRRVLIASPLMVIPQTMNEARRFYGEDLAIEQVKASNLPLWTESTGSAIGITNFEALTEKVSRGRLGALIIDESSIMKSHYGKWGQEILRLGRGLDWKLCATGTPAPNDRIEYANHAVFLDAFPTVNSFLARFFVNRGQTQDRWEIKPHAIGPFYRALSHWSIFLTNPAIYGWQHNTEPLPPIQIHIHDVDLTSQQKELVSAKMGTLFACDVGGITKRSKLSQIAKGNHNGQRIHTKKPEFVRNLVGSWPDESTLLWCLYNHEQEIMEKQFPGAASIAGPTKLEKRIELIQQFQRGERKTMISKAKVLGFGLNLQVATRQVFSGLQDSYEGFYQCIKRSNRYGAKYPLQVHIPVTDVEAPMVDNVLRKAKRIQEDTEVQENLFRQFYEGIRHA